MSSSDYTEVTLDNRRDLPYHIHVNYAELCNSRALSNDEIIDYAAENKRITEMKDSKMRRWLASPVVATEYRPMSSRTLDEEVENFPISKVFPEIECTMHHFDVTLVIAPTGSGKSVTAPVLVEMVDLDRGLEEPDRRPRTGYRKTLHVGPSVEHCASTTRAFKKLFPQLDVEVSAFLNPENEQRATTDGNGWTRLVKCRNGDARADFAYTTYHAAVQELPHANLNVLILDEIHEPNDNVQVAIAMAAKMLLAQPFHSFLEEAEPNDIGSQSLNKLLLLTATMDDDQRKKHEKYFTSQGLSFEILDFSDLNRNNLLTMSCFPGVPLPENFQYTPLADKIFEVLKKKEGVSVKEGVYLQPQQRDLDIRMKESLNTTMGMAANNLRERLETKGKNGEEDYDMQSIVIICPGLEQVDKIYCSVRKLPNFKFANDFNFGKDEGFHPVRLTSLVKDDPSITTECTKEGYWGGNLGRIIFTTNFVASGLTVPNAAYVLDMGRQNIPSEYARNGLKSLESYWIDKMMIIQRAGRTGRTTDGEYCLPYAVEKVDKMIKTDHGELLLNRNFEEKHLFLKMFYQLKLIHEPPERLIRELQKSMEIRGLYSPFSGFAKDATLMYSLLNMLTPEQARIVVQGTRLGIAAHVVYLIAHEKSRIKFCHVGTKNRGKNNGPSETKSAVDLYCEAMDGMTTNYRYNGFNRYWEMPAKYRGVGDSIALADLLVSFYSQSDKKNLNTRGIFNNFWSGNRETKRGRFTFDDLYASFVREEGEDAVSRNADEIILALKRVGIMSSEVYGTEVGVFDKEFNRHIVHEGNYCLDENGRTLISALHTMHSSRICKMQGIGDELVYHIYDEERTRGALYPSLYPESTYTQTAREVERDAIYGRFSDMFMRSGKFTGLIDPITLKQLLFFLNINAKINFRINNRENSITVDLNASTGKSGMKIKTNNMFICEGARTMRSKLELEMKILTLPAHKHFIGDLERFIINLWRECGKTEIDDTSDDIPSDAPPPYSYYSYSFLYGYNTRPSPATVREEREALNNSTARPATLHEAKEREAAGLSGGAAGRVQRGGERGDRGGMRREREGRAAGGGGIAGGAQRGGGSGRGGGDRGEWRRERGGRGYHRGAMRGGEANPSKKYGVHIYE